MKYVRRGFALLLLGLALTAAQGCKRHAAQAVDPAKAREALKTALSAWQKGESADALRNQSPSITIAESKWQGGHRLVRYEIADKDQIVGYDLECRVVLVLKDPKGRQTEEKAVFTVSTSPAVVIVRADG
jgi:hypothetical protein